MPNQFKSQNSGQWEHRGLTITYYAQETGMTYTDTKKIGTDAPENIELSNDGIDNDGDGAVDCRDTGGSDCVYLAEPTISPRPPCTSACSTLKGRQKLVCTAQCTTKYRKEATACYSTSKPTQATLAWQPNAFSQTQFLPWWVVQANGSTWIVTQDGKTFRAG